MRNKVVRKSNALIESSYRFTVNENRILYLLTLQINKDDEEFRPVDISIRDFAEFFRIPYSGSLINEIKATLRSLHKKSVGEYEKELQERFGKNSFVIGGWIDNAQYRHGESTVRVKLSDTLKPYYLNLKARYTEIPADFVGYLKGSYSFRLYELIKKEAFKGTGVDGKFEASFDYDTLRMQMRVGRDEYEKFKDFRVRVIEPAVADVNSTDIFVSNVSYGKTGRKISRLTFHVERSKQARLDFDGERKAEPVKAIEEPKTPSPVALALANFGIEPVESEKLIKRHSGAKIMRNLLYTQSKKNVTNPHAYFYTSLDRDAGKSWEEEEKARAERKSRQRQEERKQKDEEQAQKAESNELKIRALAWFNALPEDSKIEVTREFDRENPLKGSVESKAARRILFEIFLKRKYGEQS